MRLGLLLITAAKIFLGLEHVFEGTTAVNHSIDSPTGLCDTGLEGQTV